MALFGRRKHVEEEPQNAEEIPVPTLPPPPEPDLNGLRRVQDHVEYLLELVEPLKPFGMSVLEAWNQVICEDIDSMINVPPNSTSKVAGYAVRATDLWQNDQVVDSLQLATGTEHLGIGQAVLPYSYATVAGDRIEIIQEVAEGEYLRAAGEHLAVGDRLLSEGEVLTDRSVGMLAAAGIDKVLVRPRPRVVVVSSGADLVEPGESVGYGESTDANSFLISAAARAAGATVFRVAVHSNDKQELKQAITDQLIRADLVISTTGGRREEYEAVAEAMSEMGLVDAVEVAMSPGRTQTFGLIGEERVPMVMLPGNPVSAYVSFQVFVWPLLRRLMGAEVRRKSVRAIARTTMRSIWGQRHLLRAEVIDDGRLRTATRISDPFAMAELGRANALIVLDEDTELVRPGEAVQCWLLDKS